MLKDRRGRFMESTSFPPVPRPSGLAGSGFAVHGMVLAALFLLWGGCQPTETGVQSYLEGTITVRPEIDTTENYSGFRVLVAQGRGRTIDTLGSAVTDREGRFQMTVTAPERGIYPLVLWGRQGQERLGRTSYVVAPGDSGTLEVELPLERPLRVQSPENTALLGYRNTMAVHRQTLVQRLQEGSYDSNAIAQSVRQTSSVLWSLQDSYPGTYTSQLAAVESLSLLEGWNDSLVVSRAQQIEPSNPRYVEALRIARRASARLHGQQASLDLINDFEARAATEQQRAGVQAARVRAFIDSLQEEAALSAAQRLKSEHPNTSWAEWADQAMYEARNLLPGMEAPNLEVQTLEGDSLTLGDLWGGPVVLEYYRPGNEVFTRQLPSRNALHEATRSHAVTFLSISLEPDTILNQAFLNNRSLPGHHVIAPEGEEDPLVQRYNVAEIPTRFLIDADGNIVGRYGGSSFLGLQEDLTRLVGAEPLANQP